MMNIIWLCSWYPNTEDQFRGDFIQRQAMAASAFADIEVVHIVFCEKNEKSVVRVNPRLTENIFYIKRKGRLADLLAYYAMHNTFLKKYRTRKGTPALVHVQIPVRAGMIAMQWKSHYNIPYVLTEHYGIYNNTVEDNYRERSLLFRYFTKSIIRSADRFLPVSNSLGHEVNQMVTKKEYTAIPNVVDTTLFHYEPKKTRKKIRFVHVSNMAPLKNVKGILEAVAQLSATRKDFQVIFIGNRPPHILEYAETLNLPEDCCEFKSEMPYHEVAAHVRQCDAGILFSTSESQSCVVLEWLCSGLPVIASAVGGVVELITEDNGLLVPSGNINALVKAMHTLIDTCKNYDCKKISSEAISKYSYEAVGKKFHEIYTQL